jgi:hypothetical protein
MMAAANRAAADASRDAGGCGADARYRDETACLSVRAGLLSRLGGFSGL